MSDLSNFIKPDYNPEDDNFDNTPIPIGDYVVTITGAEWKNCNNSSGKYVSVENSIDGDAHPDHRGRKVWCNLNLVNDNPKTVEIASEQMTSLVFAAGLRTVSQPHELIGARAIARVKIEKGRDGHADKNGVRKWLPINSPIAARGPAAPTAAPAAAARPAAAPAGKPAWARK